MEATKLDSDDLLRCLTYAETAEVADLEGKHHLLTQGLLDVRASVVARGLQGLAERSETFDRMLSEQRERGRALARAYALAYQRWLCEVGVAVREFGVATRVS
jgi:hypothetical protein